jgi:hypothetical protein
MIYELNLSSLDLSSVSKKSVSKTSRPPNSSLAVGELVDHLALSRLTTVELSWCVEILLDILRSVFVNLPIVVSRQDILLS